MDERLLHPIPDNDDTLEVTRSMRDVLPAHYTFKIESFSLLSGLLVECGVDKHESSDFEAGGYKWRLLLYPNGNSEKDSNGHISLCLAISQTKDLPLGWEVNATFKFLVYDQIRDKYLTLQGIVVDYIFPDVFTSLSIYISNADGRVRRFHSLKTEWGIPRLISHNTLNDPSNGYLINDCCVFGVDVFVIKCKGKGETFSIMKEPVGGTFTWKLHNFSGMNKESYCSEKFMVGGCQWKLVVYPSGYSKEKGKYLSLYVRIDDYSVLRPGWKLYVKWTLNIKDQIHGKDSDIKDSNYFCASAKGWGYTRFLSLSDLHDAKKGFIVNDTLIVEVEFALISVINYFQ